MAFSGCISQALSSSLSMMKRNASAIRSEPCFDSSKVISDNRSSFIGGSRISVQHNVLPNSSSVIHKKFSGVRASWLATTQIASRVFAVGTTAVLPFYTLMVLAPKADITKKCMESSISYIVLGGLYAYLLYLTWTPDMLKYMFPSKYMLPELSGIAKMFSSEMTLASA